MKKFVLRISMSVIIFGIILLSSCKRESDSIYKVTVQAGVGIIMPSKTVTISEGESTTVEFSYVEGYINATAKGMPSSITSTTCTIGPVHEDGAVFITASLSKCTVTIDAKKGINIPATSYTVNYHGRIAFKPTLDAGYDKIIVSGVNAKMVGDSCIAENITADGTIVLTTSLKKHTVTIDAKTGIKVPQVSYTVNFGSRIAFKPILETGYDKIFVSGMNAKMVGDSCIAENITEDGAIVLTASLQKRTVTIDAKTGVHVPQTSYTVDYGGRLAFKPTLDAGCEKLTISGLNAKMVGDSCVVESITTDITITISATQSTYNINIETTDGLKVENKLLICKYGDTPTFQFQYDSIYFKNLTVSGMNAKLLDKKTCRLGPVIANGTITLSATKIQVYERTVVVSVGCTSQESGYSFWPSYEMSVKNAPGYSVYDLDINSNVEARLGTATSAILSLYKTDRSSILEADQNYYLQSCKVLSENVGYEEYLETRNILAFMKSVIDVIKNRENPTRIVFIYRGHGGGGAFFEGSLSKVDIGTLLEYTKSTLNNPEVVLDFSTTCGEGAVETLIPICKNSDYLIASELSVGFFGSIIGTSYYGFKNDYHKIWGTDNSTQVALNQEFDSFKHYWSEGVDYITRFGYKESRVLYKCSMFEQLMKTLAVDEGYYSILSNPENQSNNYDIGYYAYKSNNPGLVAAFEACRTKYLTTSYILPFDKNTRGLSVMNYYLFDIYLRSLRSTT